MAKHIVNNKQVAKLAEELVSRMYKEGNAPLATNELCNVYGVPRGGVPVAYAVCAELADRGFTNVHAVDSERSATVIVDDLVDSGATRDKYVAATSGKPFYVLIDKKALGMENVWIVFPWESSESGDESATDIPIRLLQYIGEDSERGGLLETPKRFLKAWDFWTEGYNKDAGKLLKVFGDGAEAYDQMVSVVSIPFYSKCEHHMADIFGRATISYIPNPESPKVVGLSKLSRILDMYARRLQVQERLTVQVADALEEHLGPLGVGVHLKARHMCMESRGVCQQGHHTETTALRGVIRDSDAARAEFLAVAARTELS
jgi:GTP cyclohydrolase I